MHSVFGGLLALAVFTAPNIDRNDCRTVADRYSAAAARVIEAIRVYEQCVAAHNQRNDCAAEMQALDTAHDDLADAVDDIKDCQ